MFTIATLSGIVVAVFFCGAVGNWRQGDAKTAVILLALGTLGSLFAAGVIYRLATSNDPLDWIRQPVSCSWGVC